MPQTHSLTTWKLTMNAAVSSKPTLLTKLAYPLEWLTRPPAAITDSSRRLQMRLLMGIDTVFMIAMAVLGLYLPRVEVPEFPRIWTVAGPLLFFALLSGSALLLSRSRQYVIAAYLTILMMILFAWIAIFTTPYGHAVFYTLITQCGIIAAGLFLSFRATAVITLLNFASVIVLLPPLRMPVTQWVFGPEFAPRVEPISSRLSVIVMVMLIGLSAMILIFLWVRTALERERENEREKAAEQTRLADEMRTVVNIRSQFLSNVSHELRTPLNAILGYSHSMQVMPQLYNGQTLPEIFRDDLKLIEDSGEQLLALINDLLDLSKLDAGKFEIDFSTVNLNQVCKGAIATAVGLVREKPVEVRSEVPNDLPPVWADPRRVRQILLNLLSNAIKFTQSGTVTLIVQQRGDRLHLAVQDTGPGIPASAIADLFDRFKQVNARDRLLGTGLGLDISQQLVRQHGSAISVQSTLGHGSTFSFDLPVATAAQHAQAQPDISYVREVVHFAPADTSLALQKAVLLVEDDSATRLLMRRLLESDGYAVMETHNGQEAIDAAHALLPDLILLDVNLPDISGWQVMETLQADPAAAPIPVMIVTTNPDPERAVRLGAVASLEKPVDSIQLLNRIRQVFSPPPNPSVDVNTRSVATTRA
jgi:signal transduction histidine kinase/CheY-like chemotaxis protein